MGIRGIARVTDIHHSTILNWIQQAGQSLSDEPQDPEIPEITEIDELQTFVGSKKRCDPAEVASARERAPRQQALDLDSGEPLLSRCSRLGGGGPQCSDL